MVLETEVDIGKDEETLLTPHHRSIDVLMGKSGRDENAIAALKGIQCVLWGMGAFVLALGAAAVPGPSSLLFAVGVCLVLANWSAVVFFLGLSAHVGKFLKSSRKQLFHWGWWPLVALTFCAIGVTCGLLQGHMIWATYLKRYYHIESLRSYSGIDPSVVPGRQIMDAGTVEFAQHVNIDRDHSGCFLNEGQTYCVAPIVHGGQLTDGFGVDSPRFGSYDYFAVGVGCCSCETNDFRCGQWRNPAANGGIRSTDEVSRPFFVLAAEAWAAANQKTSSSPIFFTWVESPKEFWLDLAIEAAEKIAIVAGSLFFFFFSLTIVLVRVKQELILNEVVSPKNTPGPPPGFESWWERLLPEMLSRYREEAMQRQCLQRPVPIYGSLRPSVSS